MDVCVWGNGCPRCKVLETKLKSKNIEYRTVTDLPQIVEYGKEHKINSMPILEVDGEAMDFNSANSWVNNQKQE